MIVTYNPAKRAVLPKWEQKEVECLQPEQVQMVLSALEQEPIRTQTLLTLFLVTGCRRGELLALKWANVDIDNRQLCIDGSMAYLEGCVLEGKTKTGKTRFIPIPLEAAQLLRKYKRWQMERRLPLGSLWEDSDYVFTKEYGGALNPNLVNSLLDRFCKRHGLPHIHPHVFRHTAASIMIAGGVDVLTVAQMLGHSKPTVTLNVYGHAIEDAKTKASECVADAILRCQKSHEVI